MSLLMSSFATSFAVRVADRDEVRSVMKWVDPHGQLHVAGREVAGTGRLDSLPRPLRVLFGDGVARAGLALDDAGDRQYVDLGEDAGESGVIVEYHGVGNVRQPDLALGDRQQGVSV